MSVEHEKLKVNGNGNVQESKVTHATELINTNSVNT